MGTSRARAQRRGRVLLIEDDAALRFGMSAQLRAAGYEVLEASGAAEGARTIASHRADVVLADLFLADGEVLEVLPTIRALEPAVPIYILTGGASIPHAVRAMKLGVDDVLTKPVDSDVLLHLVDAAVARRAPEGAPPSARRAPFTSDAMRRHEEQVERLRHADCSVLILGETGTGKTMLARRLHAMGARSGGPLVDVNCAGLSRELVESELFGHERGAFTGALARKVGLFEAANGGTLFLDEIGDIDLSVQPKILKAVEEKRFRRVGDVEERAVDVRLVAATHHDLLAAVHAKRFRADLYYRVSTVTLTVPPLRARKDDILPLAREIIDRRVPHGVVEITADAEARLLEHGWPGNIRELKNVIERALVLRPGRAIAGVDIRFDACPPVPAAPPTQALLGEDALGATRDDIELAHIKMALAAENGHVEAAARRLGIPRSTLYWKLKRYGIGVSRTRMKASPRTED